MPRLRRTRPSRVVERSRLHVFDLVEEALAGTFQRPGRSALTMLGTILGIGAFVTILGLTATTAGQIDSRFTALSATEVVVEDVGDAADPASHAISFTPDADERIGRLNGVVHAGVWWQVPLRNPTISAAPSRFAADAGSGDGIGLYAMDPEALAAVHPVVASGRMYDRFHESRGEHVAVLGAAAAAALGIQRVDAHRAVFIDGTPYTVVGIIADVERKPELLLSVIISRSAALAAYGPPTGPGASMLIETKLGAAQLIASQAAVQLRPDHPERFKVTAPADPKQLRGDIGADVNGLFIVLSLVCLIVGAVGIANTTLVAVMERAGEIGLRRSLGARTRHIAGQFLLESTLLGTLGGLMGTSLGAATVVAVAIARDWTAILQPWTVVPAPLVGGFVGLLAGAYPALRAALIEPVEALRR